MTATTSLKLDPKTKDRVVQLARVRRRSAHWLMREAVSQYLDREEERERLNAETMAAWAEYEETGLHLTGEEVDAWLARLEAGEEVAPPPCHR